MSGSSWDGRHVEIVFEVNRRYEAAKGCLRDEACIREQLAALAAAVHQCENYTSIVIQSYVKEKSNIS